MTSKAVAKKDETTTALSTVGAYAYDAVEMHDELDKDSYAIPRIAIIEALSPELDDGAAEYMPDAKRGQLCNRVMGELYPDGILAIPVLRRRVYLEWTPRSEGGGFVAEHNTTDGAELMALCNRNDKGYDITPNGTELHNVLEFYILASADKGATWSPAILSMSRTRMAEGKKWNQRVSQFIRDGQKVTPLAQVYELGTAKRENPEGVSYVFKVGNGQFLPEFTDNHAEVFAQASGFLEALVSGTAKVDREAEAAAAKTVREEAEDF